VHDICNCHWLSPWTGNVNPLDARCRGWREGMGLNITTTDVTNWRLIYDRSASECLLFLFLWDKPYSVLMHDKSTQSVHISVSMLPRLQALEVLVVFSEGTSASVALIMSSMKKGQETLYLRVIRWWLVLIDAFYAAYIKTNSSNDKWCSNPLGDEWVLIWSRLCLELRSPWPTHPNVKLQYFGSTIGSKKHRIDKRTVILDKFDMFLYSLFVLE